MCFMGFAFGNGSSIPDSELAATGFPGPGAFSIMIALSQLSSRIILFVHFGLKLTDLSHIHSQALGSIFFFT